MDHILAWPQAGSGGCEVGHDDHRDPDGAHCGQLHALRVQHERGHGHGHPAHWHWRGMCWGETSVSLEPFLAPSYFLLLPEQAMNTLISTPRKRWWNIFFSNWTKIFSYFEHIVMHYMRSLWQISPDCSDGKSGLGLLSLLLTVTRMSEEADFYRNFFYNIEKYDCLPFNTCPTFVCM